MGSSPTWLPRLAEALGPVGPVQPLGGGAFRVGLAHGPVAGDDPAAGPVTAVVVKVGAGVGDEADGLRRLAAVDGAPAVPAVVLHDGDLLATSWVSQGPRTTGHEERLGRQLGALHGAAAPAWGGGSSWIGHCRVDPAPGADGPSFYGRRLLDLAGRCGLATVVGPVVERLGELAPFGPPALLHGDLWWGNVLWGGDGRPWLIDPSVHGGHPEEDLAMLALFGAVPPRLLAAYGEARRLDDGWEDRVALWQLLPLLVHTVLFGGGYREQVVVAARRYGGRLT